MKKKKKPTKKMWVSQLSQCMVHISQYSQWNIALLVRQLTLIRTSIGRKYYIICTWKNIPIINILDPFLRYSCTILPSCISILIQDVCGGCLCVRAESVWLSHCKTNAPVITEQLLSEILCDMTSCCYLYLHWFKKRTPQWMNAMNMLPKLNLT